VTLEQHVLDEICAIGRCYGDKKQLTPGSMVFHREYDKSSYGMIIHVDDTNVTVLWTREPKTSGFDFRALAMPLARPIGFAKIARQLIQVDELPTGAHVFYAKDEE